MIGCGIWTSGIPFPNVEKAMLTPSLVFAYWMRSSMAGILYASGLSLSRVLAVGRRWPVRQEALAALGAAIVRLGGAGVNGV